MNLRQALERQAEEAKRAIAKLEERVSIFYPFFSFCEHLGTRETRLSRPRARLLSEILWMTKVTTIVLSFPAKVGNDVHKISRVVLVLLCLRFVQHSSRPYAQFSSGNAAVLTYGSCLFPTVWTEESRRYRYPSEIAEGLKQFFRS